MIKAGAVTVLVSLPLLLKSSAGWSYHNKAIWTVIMSQLSIARHRGEVLFSLASRVMATCEYQKSLICKDTALKLHTVPSFSDGSNHRYGCMVSELYQKV